MDVTQDTGLQRIANALKTVASADQGQQIGRAFLARLPVDSEDLSIQGLRAIARLVIKSPTPDEIRVLGAKMFAALSGNPDPFPGLSVGGRFDAADLDEDDRTWGAAYCISDEAFEALLSEKPRTTVDSIFGAAMVDRETFGGVRRDRYGRIITSGGMTAQQRQDYDDGMQRVRDKYRNAHKSPATV